MNGHSVFCLDFDYVASYDLPIVRAYRLVVRPMRAWRVRA